MTSIKDLLDPEKVKHLYLGAGSTDGNVEWSRVSVEEAQVTTINGVEYDVRSGAMVETTCADCPEPLLVDVAPVGADLDVLCSLPRTVVCKPCGQKRVAGKRGTLVHTNPKEQPMPEIRLTDYSEAELAAMAVQARARMVAAVEAEIPAKREKSVKAEKERVVKDEAKKKSDRADRRKMAGFTVKGKEVPALDLGEQSSLHETMSPKVRSPYNKVLNAIGHPLLDPETTTWEVLAETHAYLLLNHGEETKMREVKTTKAPKAEKVKAEKVKKPKKAKGKKKREVLMADLDSDAKAKIETFARIMNLTPEVAEQRLVAAGVL